MRLSPLVIRRAQRVDHFGFLLGLLGACAAVACGPETGAGDLNLGPADAPFAVSDYFVPSGAMGDGATPGHVGIFVNEGCKERPAGATGDCFHFTYTPGTELWAGVYWQHPDQNWGDSPGQEIVPSVFSKVRFQVAVEGMENLEFVAGGIDDSEKVYRDSFKVMTSAAVGPEWQAVEMALPTTDLSDHVLGAFAWIANYPPATDPTMASPKSIFIDDLVWE